MSRNMVAYFFFIKMYYCNIIHFKNLFSIIIKNMNLLEKKEFIKITKNNIFNMYDKNFNKKYVRKYTIDYYLNLMFELINDINNWYSLSKLNFYKPLQKKDNTLPIFHWKTIQNLYNKWANDGIFKKRI